MTRLDEQEGDFTKKKIFSAVQYLEFGASLCKYLTFESFHKGSSGEK